jgi:two-component system sensor histidine kinase/response regulator
LNGNRKLYKKLLLDFNKNYSASSTDIKKAIEEKNAEEAVRYAHTLKGVAGNISANDIRDVAAKLESELSKNPEGNYEYLFKELDTVINALSKTVMELARKEQHTAKESEQPFNAQDVEPVLLELVKLVWEDNIDAETALEKLRSVCGLKFTEEIDLIAQSIEDFDFEAAKLPLEKIAEKMNI